MLVLVLDLHRVVLVRGGRVVVELEVEVEVVMEGGEVLLLL